MKYFFAGALPLMLMLFFLPKKHHRITEKEVPVNERLLEKEEQPKNTEGDAILYRKNILVNIL
jgi:hypothetical protein